MLRYIVNKIGGFFKWITSPICVRYKDICDPDFVIDEHYREIQARDVTFENEQQRVNAVPDLEGMTPEEIHVLVNHENQLRVKRIYAVEGEDSVTFVEPIDPSEDMGGMGRLYSVDSRDDKYHLNFSKSQYYEKASTSPQVVKSHILLPTFAKTGYKYWNGGEVLDQLNTPHCVAYSGIKLLEAGSIVQKADFTPLSLYNKCQAVDEWVGNDYDGTSVRACMKILRKEGYIKNYFWTDNVEDLAVHVKGVGPAIVGTDWTINMMALDRDGFISYTGDNTGGHAYTIIGVNYYKKCPDGSEGAFRILNSWGRNWGDNGRAWISFNDMRNLLLNWGECALPIE